MKSFKKFFLENIKLEGATVLHTAGEYSLKRPVGFSTANISLGDIYHKRKKIATLDPHYSLDGPNDSSGKIKYAIDFKTGHGPQDHSVSSMWNHPNRQSALEAAAKLHQDWKNNS